MNEPLTTYRQAWSYLDGLQMHKIKLGLEAVRDTLADLGSPEKRCPAIHVAGTNGKGSVCSMLQAILTEAGYKTGLFTSPHLSSVRERFRIDGSYIDEADFTRLLETIRSRLDGKRITYFECTTALAFSWFAERQCDVVVLETGMGGRLDATNVVTPLCSVITTVSLDHEQYLGDTVAKVAFEKAGIIKNGVPVISGVLNSEARSVIEAVCRERRAPLMTRKIDFRFDMQDDGTWQWATTDGSIRVTSIGIRGRGAWQADNISCAVAAAVALRRDYEIPDGAVRRGIAAAHWPGRMEYLELPRSGDGPAQTGVPTYRFLLDGAHNQEGIAYLIETIRNQFEFRRLLVVWASMADKTYAPMLRDMATMADELFLTRPESERSATPEDLARALGGAYANRLECCETVERAYRRAVERAAPEDLIVVAGSLYLVGAFRRLLVGEVVS